MSTLISGQFSSREGAERAMSELMKAGFAADHISLLMSEDRPAGESTIESGNRGHRIAAVGAGLGAALGALAGGVAAASALGAPELPILAAGPLVVSVSGFAAGALTGGLAGVLFDRGMPRHTATFVEEKPGEARLVAEVFVQDDRLQDDRGSLVRSVFDACGAEPIRRA